MAVDGNIYRNGIKGLLSHYEIDTLPYDYEALKAMFHDATRRRESKEK